HGGCPERSVTSKPGVPDPRASLYRKNTVFFFFSLWLFNIGFTIIIGPVLCAVSQKGSNIHKITSNKD
ncbi:hypothetical protein J6590_102107, partial [Homalodisca vitripennis]